MAENKAPCSVSELAKQLDTPKSNIHFFLKTLTATGYVEQDPATRRYFLTLKLWEIGTRVLGRLDMKRVASPYLAALADSTSETVNLAILDHAEVVYIEKIDSPMPVRAYTPAGGRAPAYCTAMGKAILAYQTQELIQQACANMQRFTDSTISSRAGLARELERVRKLGYAVNRGEWRDEVRSVAAPVRDTSGKVIASVGVYGPASRLPPAKLKAFARVVKEAGAAISEALGYTAAARP